MAHREGPTFRELLTGRERTVWRQIKPGDSKDRLIKKTAKPRGQGSQANPAPNSSPPSYPGPVATGCRKGHLSPWKQQTWGKGARLSWCHFKVIVGQETPGVGG